MSCHLCKSAVQGLETPMARASHLIGSVRGTRWLQVSPLPLLLTTHVKPESFECIICQNTSCHTYKYIMPHIKTQINLGTHTNTNTSCNTYKYKYIVPPIQIQIHLATHRRESFRSGLRCHIGTWDGALEQNIHLRWCLGAIFNDWVCRRRPPCPSGSYPCAIYIYY